ncbi:hypothetical protein LJC56_08640 [Christensenellaceae bacterium OttesenSCG-928-K19]|nr:hypothetical protein [Christensenellaceae bacterium OttesenSCG-928-K19]
MKKYSITKRFAVFAVIVALLVSLFGATGVALAKDISQGPLVDDEGMVEEIQIESEKTENKVQNSTDENTEDVVLAAADVFDQSVSGDIFPLEGIKTGGEAQNSIEECVKSVVPDAIDVAEKNTSGTLFPLGENDTTAPVIAETIFVSLTNAQPGDSITISIEVTDDSNIQMVAFEVTAQSGGSSIAGGTLPRQGETNAFQRTITVPTNVVNGNYQIVIAAYDVNNNGSNKTFIDAFTISGGSDDSVGPVVGETITVSPTSAGSNQTITISAEITDVSGVGRVDLYLPMQMGWGHRTSMDRQGTSDVFQGTLTVPSSVFNGNYQIQVDASDILGNWTKKPFDNAFEVTGGTEAVAPTISGIETMMLSEGYTAISTRNYTITGNPAPKVTKESGNAAITWNDTSKKLDIEAGLRVGSYPVVLNAANGATPNATITFTLTVESAPVAPTISGPTAMILTEGYEAVSTDAYTIAGTPEPTVTKESGNAAIAWNDMSKKLDIAAGLEPGSYPVVLKAANGTTPDATITFALKVTSVGKNQPVQYPVITHLGTWNGNGSVICKIDAPYIKFIRLLVGENVVAPGDCIATEGSTVITLKENFLKTLADGVHTFRAEFTDGFADLMLTVTTQSNNTNSPATTTTIADTETMAATTSTDRNGNTSDGGVRTGDDTNIAFWMILLCTAGSVITGLVVYRRRKADR